MGKKYTFVLVVFIGLAFFVLLQKTTVTSSPTPQKKYPTPFFSEKDESATIAQQIIVGEHIVRLWRCHNESCPRTLTISTIEQKQIEIQSGHIWIDNITGTDLTSNGYPELVIRKNAGGSAAECDQVSIYSMTENAPALILDDISTCLVPTNSKGEPQYGTRQDFFYDLNGDGTIEFITYPYFLSDMQVWIFDTEQNKYRHIKFEEEKDFLSYQEVHNRLYPPTSTLQ